MVKRGFSHWMPLIMGNYNKGCLFGWSYLAHPSSPKISAQVLSSFDSVWPSLMDQTHMFLLNQLYRLDDDTINQHGHITWHDIKSDITVNDIFITIRQKAGPSEPRYKGEQSTAWATRPNRSLHDAQIPFQLGMFPVGGWALPLWKIWLRQLGWWHSQYMEKSSTCLKPPTSIYLIMHSFQLEMCLSLHGIPRFNLTTCALEIEVGTFIKPDGRWKPFHCPIKS